ncbi:hypothetical protein BTO06_13760 [Tenacibaculum sp. SZ-18]|uniref:DUF423 domain-containing protein n=1 Tax=Tenacibaculum sp. SZ-18 TaxID=754423 RepID=UPI000C2D0A87|nr:DUF423 domain-containing protein [Tenacibaculum sp. SZ-18]AUC16160.1 hypothetical protein BTO06_13760 [Tenacibaculum sp. SZ-18]
MYKNLTITTFLGVVTIILGAFGAHALKESLTPEALKSFETAVRYQMYHVIVLLLVNFTDHISLNLKNKLTLIFISGVALFSGSIYLIYLLGVPVSSIWFVTPLGGLILIIGWILLFYEFLKKSMKK